VFFTLEALQRLEEARDLRLAGTGVDVLDLLEQVAVSLRRAAVDWPRAPS
jgi:hypothetical protein